MRTNHALKARGMHPAHAQGFVCVLCSCTDSCRKTDPVQRTYFHASTTCRYGG